MTTYIFIAILILSLIPRLYKITNPATYHLHPIRQFQGAMMARDFHEREMNILDPRLDAGTIQSPPPAKVALEFQLMPWIAAIFYKLFGVHKFFGNLLSIVFYIGSAVFFFLIAKKFLKDEYALLATLIFCFSPESFKYSRAFMPDFLVLLFSLGSIYFFLSYMEIPDNKNFAYTAVFLLFTFLTKINYFFSLIIVWLYMFYKFGWKFLLRRELIALSLIPTIPSISYYLYAVKAAEGGHNYVSSMISHRVLPYLSTNLLSVDFYHVIFRGISAVLTLPGILIALAGVGLIFFYIYQRKNSFYIFLLIWLIAIFIYMLVMGRDLLRPHIYYFLPILPVGSILIGMSAEWTGSQIAVIRKREKWLIWMWFMVAAFGSMATLLLLQKYYDSIQPEVNLYLNAASQIKEVTKPDELIVFDTEDTGWTYFIMYHSGRRGWHLWQPQKRSELENTVAKLKQLGADYIYVLSPEGYRYLPVGAFDWGFVESLKLKYRKVPQVKVGELYALTDGCQ